MRAGRNKAENPKLSRIIPAGAITRGYPTGLNFLPIKLIELGMGF
jgi:hypothetical protein